MSAILTTSIILVAVLIAMVRTNRAPDFIVWAGVCLLVVVPVKSANGAAWQLGVLDVHQALNGLANEGVVTIAALFIVAAGLRETGGLALLSRRILGAPRSLFSAQNRIVWPTAMLSGFFNNTPLVALLIPVTTDWAKRYKISISHLLIPLSYASILGGACTLIGTSTNLVVNGWIVDETDHPSLGMFEITPVALPIALVGLGFLLATSRWLLPDRQPAFRDSADARRYIVEMMVEEEGELVGKSIEDAGLRGLPGLFLIEIDRDGDILPAVSAQVQLHGGDRLMFAGIVDSVVDLQNISGLTPATDQVFKLDQPRQNRVLVEAVVSNTCPLVGMTIKEGRFRTNYNAAVIAVARNGEHIKKKIGDIQLRAGDTLLLEARPSFHEQQRNRSDFYLTNRIEAASPITTSPRSVIALALVALVVICVTSGLLSMLQASLAAAMLIVVTGCCSASQARQTIDWEVLLVIAGALALGKAMAVSGLADAFGHQVLHLFGWNEYAMLAAIYGLAMILAGLVTAKAGAVLVLPIALAAAQALDVSYMPFLIAVMLAASTTLATPIGYPTNLMVYGPGGYHYSDYLRIGLPLSLLIWVLAVFLIPLAWPFTNL